jgi:hypothetical protein
MKQIETDISATGFQRSLAEVIKYRDKLIQAQPKIVSRLVYDGVVMAKGNANAMVLGENTDGAINGTNGEVNGDNGRIFNNEDDATYAEFGVGIVGSENPHPALQGWVYDVNEHGEKGWWFPTTDARYIRKKDKSGQTWGWTKGNASQPFMWETAKRLRAIAPDTVSKILKEIK